jgi:hypothetical protein
MDVPCSRIESIKNLYSFTMKINSLFELGSIKKGPASAEPHVVIYGILSILLAIRITKYFFQNISCSCCWIGSDLVFFYFYLVK